MTDEEFELDEQDDRNREFREDGQRPEGCGHWHYAGAARFTCDLPKGHEGPHQQHDAPVTVSWSGQHFAHEGSY